MLIIKKLITYRDKLFLIENLKILRGEKIMKKQKTILSFLIFMIIIIINVKCFAFDEGFFDGKINGDGTDSIFSAASGIINLVQWVGAATAIIATIILGIKYMYSAPTEKATIKNRLIPWIVGGLLIFGAMQLVKFIENLVTL